jgi:hypothetical protein
VMTVGSVKASYRGPFASVPTVLYARMRMLWLIGALYMVLSVTLLCWMIRIQTMDY